MEEILILAVVSVILPVYNAEKYIESAIKSVLAQDFIDFELIIVNDGSTDGSLKLIEGFKDSRIILINKENQGISHALNDGLRFASGEFIARMDADDICHPRRISRQVEFLRKNSSIVLVASNVIYIDEHGEYLGFSCLPGSNSAIRIKMSKGNIIFHPTVMFRSATFNEKSLYDEKINKYIEDYLLWHKFLRVGSIAIMQKPLLKYRVSTASVSRSAPASLSYIVSKIGLSSGYYAGLYEDFVRVLGDKHVLIRPRSPGVNLPLVFQPYICAVVRGAYFFINFFNKFKRNNGGDVK